MGNGLKREVNVEMLAAPTDEELAKDQIESVVLQIKLADNTVGVAARGNRQGDSGVEVALRRRLWPGASARIVKAIPKKS
jgi:hypothetical protein